MRECKDCGKEAAPGRTLCMRCKNQRTYRRNMTPCKCGCGELAAKDFIAGHHTRLFSSEEQSRRGRMNNGDKQRDPPGATGYRKIRGRHEHRTVAEQMLGRPLESSEIVHHINGDKRDNRPENLEITTQSDHINKHREDLIRGQRRARTKQPVRVSERSDNSSDD